MDDLISRKAVLDIILGELGFRCGYDADIALLSVKKCVSELPTAYDVEKVVECLEEIKGQGCVGVKCKDCKYTHNCFEGEKAENVVIDKAIEIIRRGGVE